MWVAWLERSWLGQGLTANMNHVPFDPDLADIGVIEPEFVDELVGWANEEMLINAEMLPIASFGKEFPDAWVPGAFTRRPLPEPKPIIRRTLRWRERTRQ